MQRLIRLVGFFEKLPQVTYQNSAIREGLLIGEVAHRPGQVVRGHARGPGEVVRHPPVVIGDGVLHGHVGEGQVRGFVLQTNPEGGLVDGLVKTREGFSGVGRGKLSHRKIPAMQRGRLQVVPLWP